MESVDLVEVDIHTLELQIGGANVPVTFRDILTNLRSGVMKAVLA